MPWRIASLAERSARVASARISVARAALQGRERLARLDRSRARSLSALMERSRRRLDGQAKLLSTLSHHNVLARGFALVRDADGTMLRRAEEVRPGAALDIEFADGHVGAHADPRERKSEPKPDETRKRGSGKQETSLIWRKWEPVPKRSCAIENFPEK